MLQGYHSFFSSMETSCFTFAFNELFWRIWFILNLPLVHKIWIIRINLIDITLTIQRKLVFREWIIDIPGIIVISLSTQIWLFGVFLSRMRTAAMSSKSPWAIKYLVTALDIALIPLFVLKNFFPKRLTVISNGFE